MLVAYPILKKGLDTQKGVNVFRMTWKLLSMFTNMFIFILITLTRVKERSRW